MRGNLDIARTQPSHRELHLTVPRRQLWRGTTDVEHVDGAPIPAQLWDHRRASATVVDAQSRRYAIHFAVTHHRGQREELFCKYRRDDPDAHVRHLERAVGNAAAYIADASIDNSGDLSPAGASLVEVLFATLRPET